MTRELLEMWPVMRWACVCGRFIRAEAIEETTHVDHSAYYGISTAFRYTCTRCGVVEGSPRLVEVGQEPIWSEEKAA